MMRPPEMITRTLMGMTNHGVTVGQTNVFETPETGVMRELLPLVENSFAKKGVPDSALND